MNNFTIAVYRPTGANSRIPVMVPAGLDVQPRSWSAIAKGGMWDAEIAILGPVDELSGLTSWLGCEVEIANDRGTPVWWGDITTVEITSDGLRKGISLNRMANRVMVRYAEKQAGGSAVTVDTAWLDDALSQTTYGIWERRITPDRPMTANEATAHRATALGVLAEPHRTLVPDSGKPAAKLLCTGYWQRTKRTYYSELRGLEQYVVDDSTGYPLGLGIVSSTSIAFCARVKTITQINGYCKNIATGYKVRVSGAGTAGNNTTYTVTEVNDKDPVVYTSNSVEFAPLDDVFDNNDGLGFLDNDDVFVVTGSGLNSGTHILNKAGSYSIEVSAGYHGATIQAEPPATITIYRGNHIAVTPTPTNEGVGASVTATVWGQRYYQTFTPSVNGSWTVDGIELRLQRVGGPADSVQVQLYTDNAGAPNTLLKSAQVAADDISLDMDWVAFDFDNAQVISYGTTYGLVISRTGANDWDDYYMLDVYSGGGYSGGSQKAYDGAAYQAINADLMFRILGGVDTGTQIEDILLSLSWPSVLKTASGIVSHQYRDGELRAYDELEALLDTGTSAGRRLLASVTRLRGAVIAAKPDKATARWAWQASKRLTDLHGQDAEPGYLPAGEWVKLGNASTLGPWAALSPVFIERAEYNADSGWDLEPEGAGDPFDTGTVQG